MIQNPNKLCLGPGGSSGGEGALIAMRGSILGFGTDIGGSIRIPALCNGSFGFRPTSNRIPYGGQAQFQRDGYPQDITCVAGPLAHSARDIHMILRTVIQSKPWELDFTAAPTPWTPSKDLKKLTIGYIAEDSKYTVAPPLLRVMGASRDKLEEAGHNIVTLEDFPSFPVGCDVAWSYFDLDNDQIPVYKFTADSGEPLISSVKKWYGETSDSRKDRTLEDLYEMNVQRALFKQRWHDIFKEKKLDVILVPGSRNTAVLHDKFEFPAYTAMWNLVDVS